MKINSTKEKFIKKVNTNNLKKKGGVEYTEG